MDKQNSDKNFWFFFDNKETLQKKYPGKHIVISNAEVAIIADSRDEAFVQSIILAHNNGEDVLDYCTFDCDVTYGEPYRKRE